MIFFFAGHCRVFFLEVLPPSSFFCVSVFFLSLKVIVSIKDVVCHQLWTLIILCATGQLEQHYFIVKESTKNCSNSRAAGGFSITFYVRVCTTAMTST